MTALTLFTIGYEGLGIDAFVSLLIKNGVQIVVDIRELPLSRKPGFSKKALAGAINRAGIEYVHMPTLGCPRPVRARYRQDGDWTRYTKNYLQYLTGKESAIAELSERAQLSNAALLCYEANYEFCHRSLVANAVRDYCGVSIQHIKTTEARTGRFGSRPAVVV